MILYFVWYFIDKYMATSSRNSCTSGLEIGACCNLYLLKLPLGSCVSEKLDEIFTLYILDYALLLILISMYIDPSMHIFCFCFKNVNVIICYMYLAAIYIDNKNKNCACRRASTSSIY